METNLETGMRFSPRKNSSKTRCCVFGCQSVAREDPTVRFHSFPKIGEIQVPIINKYNCTEYVDRRWAWDKVLKIKSLTPTSRVCSLHFKKDDYILPDMPAKNRYLQKSAVPSVNLPALEPITEKTEIKKNNDLKRIDRVRNRSLEKKHKKVGQKNLNKNENLESERTSNKCLENIENIENESVEKAILENTVSSEIEHPALLHQDKAVQTKLYGSKDKEVQVLFENYSNFIRTDKDLSTITYIITYFFTVP